MFLTEKAKENCEQEEIFKNMKKAKNLYSQSVTQRTATKDKRFLNMAKHVSYSTKINISKPSTCCYQHTQVWSIMKYVKEKSEKAKK